MNDLNNVSLIGRLTHDLDLKSVGDNGNVTEFTIAVNRGKEADYVRCEAWNGVAEAATGHLEEGDRVAVDGRIAQDSWETGGEDRDRLKVVADQVQFLNRT